MFHSVRLSPPRRRRQAAPLRLAVVVVAPASDAVPRRPDAVVAPRPLPPRRPSPRPSPPPPASSSPVAVPLTVAIPVPCLLVAAPLRSELYMNFPNLDL